MLDLLQTGKYGVLTNQKLLGTTSNNITNVNTVGYTRQQTIVYTSAIDWGVGATYTRRMYDQYAQRELFRDQGNVGFYDAYGTSLGTVDKLLSNEDTSVGTSLNSLFSSMQSAVQNTTSLANRRELLTQFENLTDRFHTLNYNIKNELNDINAKIGDTAQTINDLVKGIYEVNRDIRNMGSTVHNSELGAQLLDKRDQMINELSTYVDVNVTTESDGSVSLYLGNGQLLVNGDTYGQLNVTKNQYDPSYREVNLTFQNPQPTTIELGHDAWGGRLGGYLNSSDEIRQSMRDLGRLAIAFADAMNEQNKSGITLEGIAGKDLISIPSVNGVAKNKGDSMVLSFNPGEGADVRNNDYKVVFEEGSDKPTVYMIENGKEVKLDPDTIIKDPSDPSGKSFKVEGHGITLTFNKTVGELAKSKSEFMVQPTINAGFDIKCNITKPEEFAFASAIVVNTNGHAGNAVAEMNGVYHTGTSAQDAAENGLGIFIGPDGKPQFTDNAPTKVVFEGEVGSGQYVIYNSKGEKIGSAPESCNGKNIFANATWEDTSLPDGFPGYEVSFTGTVVNGSSFDININTDGKNDNSNGNLLANLQQEDLVFATSNSKSTFTQNYADLTSAIGSAVMSATTDLNASIAKYEQSYNLFYSKAGVNLDEEAANLIRYQQSYSACAKIINASQTIFDALISSI